MRQHLSRLPTIDPNTRTLLLCGYPNVGKSSFINKVGLPDGAVTKDLTAWGEAGCSQSSSRHCPGPKTFFLPSSRIDPEPGWILQLWGPFYFWVLCVSYKFLRDLRRLNTFLLTHGHACPGNSSARESLLTVQTVPAELAFPGSRGVFQVMSPGLLCQLACKLFGLCSGKWLPFT